MTTETLTAMNFEISVDIGANTDKVLLGAREISDRAWSQIYWNSVEYRASGFP